MQLGTRWVVHAEPPERLDAAIVDAVRAVEGDLVRDGVDAGDWRWTLTYLEGKPVVELDDGTTIRLAADGSAHVTVPEDPEDEER